MKMFTLIVALLGFAAAPSMASPAEEAAELKTAGGTLHGTLLVPESTKPIPVVLLIAGSGPTDRNGNSVALPGSNNSLKMLAEGLAAKGIASLRFDKRGIAGSRDAGAAEKDLRFDMYVDDAAAWAGQLKKDHRFSSVTIVGHSEGALIGTVAAQRGAAAAFVSIAGVSRAADVVLRGQLAGKLPPDLQEISERTLTVLKSGKTVDDTPQSLAVLYRPSVQPYLISWFRYDPIAELKKVKIPILIVQGTTDIQVAVDDARAFAAARPDARLEIIDGMNHVMKIVDADTNKQIASYSDPALPIAPHLVEVIAAFVAGKSPNPRPERVVP
jgi:pimeloyl-ACP methyl ester carboxylesterase